MAGNDWHKANQGLPMHRPPGQQVPLRPYPFMPSPSTGSVFRVKQLAAALRKGG